VLQAASPRVNPKALDPHQTDHSLGPLYRRPQLDPLRAPLVQLASPLAQALRRVLFPSSALGLTSPKSVAARADQNIE